MASINALIGFCANAGALTAGYEACKKAMLGKKALLALVSPQTGENTRKDFFALCEKYGVELLECDFSEASGRASSRVAVITQAGFAKAVKTEYYRIYPRNI